MTVARMIELAVGVAILIAGVWLYRRPAPAMEGGGRAYGSPGAVILFVIAAIVLIHALGGLDYRPSSSELEALR
jgi:hypothetical protein